jgi:HK97 family phage prohead protease
MTRIETGFPVAEFKAASDTSGEFEALISVFGNVDLGGDRVVKGAFAKSLAKWEESGAPIPVYWNHQWDDPFANIGAIDPRDAKETDDGLLVKGTLDVGKNPLAAQVHHLLSERRVKEFSFGYTVKDSEKAKDGALNLLEVDIIEGGPTLKGMNPETQLLAVKAYDQAVGETKAWADAVAAKAGARLSKATRSTLEQAYDLLGSLLSEDDQSPESPKSDEAEASGKASDADDTSDIFTRINLLKEKLQ